MCGDGSRRADEYLSVTGHLGDPRLRRLAQEQELAEVRRSRGSGIYERTSIGDLGREHGWNTNVRESLSAMHHEIDNIEIPALKNSFHTLLSIISFIPVSSSIFNVPSGSSNLVGSIS